MGDLGKGAAGLEAKGLITQSTKFTLLPEKLAGAKDLSFAFAVVDEPQDVRIGQLRLLATLLGEPPKGLFFAGDSQADRKSMSPLSGWDELN